MSIAATQTMAIVAVSRNASHPLCRRWLAAALLSLLAVQAVLSTRVWEYPYARLLMPDVMRTDTGYITPPLVTVRDHHIVDFQRPGRSPGCTAE